MNGPKPARIVVADGDSLTRRFLGGLLRQQGHEVVEAEDGDQALRRSREQDTRLLIVDALLPLRDGYEVLETVKADAATRRVPVLMLSARSREEDVVKGLRLGAEDYVTKPFNTQELMLRIRKILDRSW